MTNNKNITDDFSFHLDGAQSTELGVFESEIFPSTRSGFIELVEDKPDDIKYGAAIKCESLEWEFKCPLKWSKLKKTKFDDVRFCTLCEERVYTAYSKAELKRLTSQGSCVRVITEKQLDVMGGMSDPYDFQLSDLPEGMLLIDAITELANQVNNFKKRRGFYPILKLKRLLGRLDRFEQQIQSGLRDRQTGLSDDCQNLSEEQQMEYKERAALVMRFLGELDRFERMLQEADEYITFRSLTI